MCGLDVGDSDSDSCKASLGCSSSPSPSPGHKKATPRPGHSQPAGRAVILQRACLFLGVRNLSQVRARVKGGRPRIFPQPKRPPDSGFQGVDYSGYSKTDNLKIID